MVASSPIGSGQITLMLGNGVGGFTTVGTYTVTADPDSIAVADLNRDGYPDIIVGSTSPTATANANLNVLLNTGVPQGDSPDDDGFDPAIPVTLFPGAKVESVTATDINGDAFPDLVVSLAAADGQDNNVYALLGAGNAHFRAHALHVGAASP